MIMKIRKAELIKLGTSLNINDGKLMLIKDNHEMIVVTKEDPFCLKLIIKLDLLIGLDSIRLDLACYILHLLLYQLEVLLLIVLHHHRMLVQRLRYP